MIVPMKKVSVVVLDAFREQSLEKLRDTGVFHLEGTDATSEALTDLREKRSLLEQAIRLLPEATEGNVSVTDPHDAATKIIGLSERRQLAGEEAGHLEREADRLSRWGDFDPADVITLREKGIDIRLYRLTRQQMEEIPEETRVFILNETKSMTDLAVVSTGGSVDLPFDEVPLPEQGLGELKKTIEKRHVEIEEIRRQLEDLTAVKEQLEAAVGELDSNIEFESASAGMGVEEKLAFLTGYAPERTVEDLKKAASENGWGLLVEDPGEEDSVPTLIENPKWIRTIKPVFDILLTLPGYRERDISMLFLFFFSVFFAMIVGDGGYGIIFLVAALVGRKFLKSLPKEAFVLMYVLSTCTIIWGAVTGNWFGCEAIAKWPVLNVLVIEPLNAFSDGSFDVIAHICFVLAAVHLAVAHLIVAFHYANSLKALAQLGWALVICGLFFVLKQLVLNIPAPDFAWHGILSGLGLVLFFTSPSKNIFKTVGIGLGEILQKALGAFADSFSYIRLAVVGMVTLAVAQSFNAMSAKLGFSEVYLALGAALILFIGHSLNITLALMSVLVHGVRLNMLEFSGHLGLEWSGHSYNPFRKKEKV